MMSPPKTLSEIEGSGLVRLLLPEETDSDDGIARVVFYNPDKKNALSPKMMREFSDIVTRLETWTEGYGVVLCGDERESFFSSGADLEFVRSGKATSNMGQEMSNLMHDALNRFRACSLISIAAIGGGGAVGGGTEIALSCDFRVMELGAKWHMVHARLGLTPGWGGGTRLVDIVGRKEALRFLAGSVPVTAKRAKSVGLVDQIVEKGKALDASCMFLTKTFGSASLNRDAVRACKRLIGYVDGSTGEGRSQCYATEKDIFQERWNAVVVGGDDDSAATSTLTVEKVVVRLLDSESLELAPDNSLETDFVDFVPA
eukprot:g2897.t1